MDLVIRYAVQDSISTEGKGKRGENGKPGGLVTLVGTGLSEWKYVKEKGKSRIHSCWEELCRAQYSGVLWMFVLEFLREVRSLTSE